MACSGNPCPAMRAGRLAFTSDYPFARTIGAMSEEEQIPRGHTRHRSLKQGLVSYHNDDITVPCIVRDLSEGGAKLQFERLVQLPKEFFLNIPLDGAKYPAEVQWTRGQTCGVRFTGPPTRSRHQHHQVISPTGRDAAAAAATREAPGDPEPPARGFAAPTPAKAFGRRK